MEKMHRFSRTNLLKIIFIALSPARSKNPREIKKTAESSFDRQTHNLLAKERKMYIMEQEK